MDNIDALTQRIQDIKAEMIQIRENTSFGLVTNADLARAIELDRQLDECVDQVIALS